MTVSPRDQYLSGKNVVQLTHRRLATYCVPVVAAGGQPRVESGADLRQATYYHEVFDVLRTAVLDGLEHHRQSMADRLASEDLSDVRRVQRIVSVMEAELATIDNITAALSSRFPDSQIQR